jgi:hypothetical protein
LDVKVVDHGINLNFEALTNSSTICWQIKDCSGNTIYNDCSLSSENVYSQSLTLDQGCYQFILDAGSSTIGMLSLTDFCGKNTLISGTNVTGKYSRQFTVGESGSNPEFNIYPNPAINQLIIEASFNELYQDARFSISNLRGEVVIPLQNLLDRLVVNVSHLPRGIYIIDIQTSRGKFARRIVKL